MAQSIATLVPVKARKELSIPPQFWPVPPLLARGGWGRACRRMLLMNKCLEPGLRVTLRHRGPVLMLPPEPPHTCSAAMEEIPSRRA